MNVFVLSFYAGLLAAGSLGAATIQFEVTDLGKNGAGETVDRYTYTANALNLSNGLSGFTALDIEFDPVLVGSLSNSMTGTALNTLLLQPNAPMGAPGFLVLTAASGGTQISDPFSVDFVFLGSGVPGPQAFLIKQFDSNGKFLGTIESGSTNPAGQAVPEPSTLVLGGILLATGLVWRPVRFFLTRAI